MSDDSINTPQQRDDNRFSWISNAGVLLSPFLWVAVVGAGFIIHTLWPDGSDKGSVVGDEGNSAGWLDSLSSWLADNDLMIAALVAVVITLVALGAGTKKAWKREAVVTEWMVYTIAAVGIVGVFYYLGTEYLYGDGAEVVRQKNLNNIAVAFDPRIEPDENGLSIWWYIGGIAFIILFIAGIATSKDGVKVIGEGLGKLAWPLAFVAAIGLAIWVVATGQINLQSQTGAKTQVAAPSLQNSVLIETTWSNWVPIPCGKTVSWGQSVDVDKMMSADGKWVEAIRFKSDRYAGITMPLAWTDAPCYK